MLGHTPAHRPCDRPGHPVFIRTPNKIDGVGALTQLQVATHTRLEAEGLGGFIWGGGAASHLMYIFPRGIGPLLYPY